MGYYEYVLGMETNIWDEQMAEDQFHKHHKMISEALR